MSRRRARAPALTAIAGAFACVLWARLGPLPPGLLDVARAGSATILDRHGEVLYEARAADGSRSLPLDAAEVPAAIADATVAAEDHRFWRHPGIDPIALVRAAVRDIRSRHIVEGGSTITQQTVKLLLARQGRSPGHRNFAAKMREGILALRLEHRLTKREILALYLNLASYGNQLVGAERASREYFGRSVALLTPAQAAFLASLPQRPTSFNPYRDTRRARERQQRVLVRMALLGMLTPDAWRTASDERLSLDPARSAFTAAHFVQRVGAAAAERNREIRTTLDAELQRSVQGIIRAERGALDRYGAHNVAAVVLDNRSGEWLAWEGSGDYADAAHGGAIDGVVAPRQPGSALKPFTYAVAFENGDSPASVLADVPSYFPTAQSGVLYSPRNYDDQFRGPLLARRALAGSENVPAVALASRVGVPTLIRFLRSVGFTTFDKTGAYYGLGVTLGDAEVRLDELVTAYAMFARGGVAVRPTMTPRAPDRSPDGDRIVSERTAFWITDILSDNDARAFAFGRGSSLEFPFPVAAKTGTSQGYHDNWAVGYTQAVTVGVWVGNFDRRPLVGSSGVSGAGPIFHAILLAAEHRVAGELPAAQRPTTAAPIATTQRRICALSGMAATGSCPNQIDEWVPSDVPAQRCAWHQTSARGVVVAWPAEYLAWADQERLVNRVAAPTASRGQPIAAGDQPLRVLSPPDGAVYLIDPTLRREFQSVPLRAASNERSAIEWRVDERLVGRAGADGRVDWPLAAGRHVVTAVDDRGRRAAAVIVVK